MVRSLRLPDFDISTWTRYFTAWMLAVTTAGIYLYFSWHHFDNPDRRDGNRGHTFMDFGGQYLLGRMLVCGKGQHLFDRTEQHKVLQQAYPRENESPWQEMSDAEKLMRWFLGTDDSEQKADDSIGGPLYPPLQAFWFYPLAILPPQVAYRVMQILIVLGAFMAGLGLGTLSNGRVWWPLASTVVIVFPGFAGTLGLGQNSVISLNILIWGWVLISRGHPGWGGVVWGLLAFKPVWAAAFFLVPLWTGRWRVCIAMLTCGIVQAALTLPLVGWHSWMDWLKVGREAARVSQYDEVWITRGRDLIALPSRWLDFNDPTVAVQNHLTTNLIGWGLWLVAIEVTTRIAALRKPTLYVDCGLAFLFFGAWLSCVHFMYYDVLLAALPVFLFYLGVQSPHWICHILVFILFLSPAIPALEWGEPPLETLCITGLWIASGWVWIRREARDYSDSRIVIGGLETETGRSSYSQ
jgi:hypothetical protein